MLEPHKRKWNLKFQINGDSDCEKIVFRIYPVEHKRAYKSRYSYRQGMDSETAEYLDGVIRKVKGDLNVQE